jgi:AraC family transcriptional regulator of adaptative response/methylated-DNA-[protein]-cysteine methyltransferase
MEQAYLGSDAGYHGLFFLGVRTTGIFCRPTCPARKPLPRNVEYFPSVAAAQAAGYRPCKRCRPLEDDEQPAWARQLIAEVERAPAPRISDADLKGRGVDPATVRRYFQRRYDMTFQAYVRQRRLAGAMQQLQHGQAIDDAVFASGYDSHSGFREAFVRTFGSPPGASAGRDCVFLGWFSSPLGPLIAAATRDGVCMLEFADHGTLDRQSALLRRHFDAPVVPGSHEHLERLEAELDEYFAGALQSFTVPLTYPGTRFQRRVWDQLRAIPYGETRSYEDIAVAIGAPRAARAVGRANGLNRICILIPCHRVVAKDGGLGGYASGLRRKQFLLELEQARLCR